MVMSRINHEVRSPIDGLKLMGHSVTFGASGAVSTESTNSGIAATRDAAGTYSFVIDPPAQRCWFLSASHYNGGGAVDIGWQVETEFVAATRTIVLANAPAGSDTDPTSGDTTVFWFVVSETNTGFTPDTES